MLSAISWLAVTAGFAGTWIAGKHRAGWLVGVTCCLLWLAYDIDRAIWAGAFAAIIGTALNLRNWHIGARDDTNRTTECEPTSSAP